MKIGYRDVYEMYCKLVIHAETVSWQRFHVFLVMNSILVLAWVTLFKDGKALAGMGSAVMTAIPAVGVLAALAWEDLGD